MNWSKIVFSDECMLFPLGTKTRILWSPFGSQRSPPYIESLKKKSINVWGFMRYDGRVGLVRFEETMEEDQHINLLEDHLNEAIVPMRHSSPPTNVLYLERVLIRTSLIKTENNFFEERGLN